LTSGDTDARDSKGEGFDGILDAANFGGGPFSYFNGQAIGLVNTNLSNFQSFYPDLQTNKFEGQSNSVNPGLILLGGAVDVEVTPTTRGQVGLNYLRFSETDVLETYLQLPSVDPEIGTELFVGLQWRPWLTNNVIFLWGVSALDPGDGWARLYESDDTVYQAFFNATVTW